MRSITYTIVGLSVLSLVFFAGNSFSQDWSPWNSAEITAYGYDSGSAAGGGSAFTTSRMLWSQVYTPDAIYLATISDLVADPADGRVSNVILSGIKNLGAEEVSIPFSRVERLGSSFFVYRAPADLYQYYGEAPYWTEGFYRYADEKMPMGSFRIGESIGAAVRSFNGEELGRINDFVIDPMDGHLTFVVLFDVGGMDGKMAAVPFDALSKGSDRSFVLNTTRETLLSAPAFGWQDINNREYAGEIYRHYGLRPYWE